MGVTRVHYCIYIAILALMASQALALPSTALRLTTQHTRTTAAADTAVTAHRQRLATQDATNERMRAMLLRARVITERTALPTVPGYILTGTPTRTAVTRTRTENVLSFAYEGWGEQQTTLSNFITAAYPEMVAVYGAPSTHGTLTIISDVNASAGGELHIDQTTGAMSLRLRPLTQGFGTIDDSRQYALTVIQQLLHAFHGPALIGFDAWEDGMARAASILVMRRLNAPYNGFDVELSQFWLLPIYDVLNQPELATPSYVPMASTSSIYHYRVGMAMAAWFKIYAESASPVFAQFNQAYYAAYATSPNTASNLSQLKTLLAGVLPTVEGDAFVTWYDKQYVLQPTALLGQQLYVFATPLENHQIIFVHHYSVQVGTGQTVATETALSGTANLYFTLFNGYEYFPEEGYNPTTETNTVVIGNWGDPGIGYIAPSFYNIYDEDGPSRIATKVLINGLDRTIYYPYLGYGTDEKPNLVFGSLIGPTEGNLLVSTAGRQMTASLSMGAFGMPWSTTHGTFDGFYRLQYKFTGTDNVPITLYRNIGPGGYAAMLKLPNPPRQFVYTFPAGMSLVSFPVSPQMPTDPGTLFGYQQWALDFRFAWWQYDASAPLSGKYTYYPDAEVAAITPGRGYWLALPPDHSNRTVTITGSDPEITSVILQPGWNLVGNLYSTETNPWHMRVRVDIAKELPIGDAVQQNIIGPLWTYHPTGKYYQTPMAFKPWEGAWIFNNTGGPLTLIQNGTRQKTRTQTGNAPVPVGGWEMEVQARAGEYRDSIRVGIAAAARRGVDGLDWRKPPAFGPGLYVALTNQERKIDGAAYASDFRAMLNPTGEVWDFSVTSPHSGPVTLSIPRFPQFPGRYRVALQDSTTGGVQYLRNAPTYTYIAAGTTDEPETRQFRLIIDTKPAGSATFLDNKSGTAR